MNILTLPTGRITFTSPAIMQSPLEIVLPEFHTAFASSAVPGGADGLATSMVAEHQAHAAEGGQNTTAPAPKPRSPAQIAASRINGARSRGPRTRAGKTRSAGNSIRHGVLARKIIPLPGRNHEDREYALLLEELAVEFDAHAGSRRCLVEVLASDYVHLGRVVVARDTAMAVATAPTTDTFRRPTPYCLDSEAAMDLLERLRSLADGEGADEPALAVEQSMLERVVHLVNEHVEVLRSWAEACRQRRQREAEGTPTPEEEVLDEDFIAEQNQAMEQWEAIRPDLLSATEKPPVMRVLTDLLEGTLKLPVKYRRRWGQLLALTRDWLKRCMWHHQETWKRDERDRRRDLGYYFHRHLEKLQPIQRYEASIRRNIEKTTRLLLNMRGAGEAGIR